MKPEQPETSQTTPEGTTGRENPGGKGDEQEDAYTAQTDSGNINGIKIKFICLSMLAQTLLQTQ